MQVHEEEIVFLVNSADPSLVEAYTNSAHLCRQLEAHGAQRLPTPRGEDNSLRGHLVRHLSIVYLLKARQVRFFSVDVLKSELRVRRAERKRKEALVSEEEKEQRAKRAAWARQWRAKQSPEKMAKIREQSQQAKKRASVYERELRNKQARENWAKLSPERRDEIRERDRLTKAARRKAKLNEQEVSPCA